MQNKNKTKNEMDMSNSFEVLIPFQYSGVTALSRQKASILASHLQTWKGAYRCASRSTATSTASALKIFFY